MALQKETVAIPFASGIRPQTRARLLDAQKLLVAQNCYFNLDQGPEKRNGHESHLIRTNATYPGLNGNPLPLAAPVRANFSFDDPGLSASWLYGWGIYSDNDRSGTDPFSVSAQPGVGQLFGATTRDSEVVVWDGHRVFSYAPGQPEFAGETQSGTSGTSLRGPACMPALRSQPIAKIADAQLVPDGADNGVLRVVAWLNSDGVTGAYSAYDSNDGAALVANKTITYQTPKALRCLSVGSWFHIIVSDPTANLIELRSFHENSPNTIVSRNLGAADIQFDVKKIDETSFVVIKSKGGVITAFVMNMDGSTLTTFIPALGGFAATAGFPITCAIDRNNNLGIAWQTTGAPTTVNFSTYNLAGGSTGALATVTTVTAARRMTLSPRYVLPNDTHTSSWDLFVEDLSGSGTAQVRCFSVLGGTVGILATLNATRHRTVLASHAFRVGDRNFAWCASWLTGSIGLQTTWFLCDSAVLPVGKLWYGQANADLGTTLNTLTSVNYHVNSSSHPFKDRIVYYGALPYNQRVENRALTDSPNGVFTEPSISFYTLDFLPRFVASQAGRSSYFAGAQLWTYDGAEVVESGFHMAPEGVTGVRSAGGSLSAGDYRYRVDLCHKNAQNEEVRSWSIITAAITAVALDKITLTIPVMPMTRREDSYFLIFRTEANGTVYYLANSRDPSNALFLRNNQANPTFTYVDQIADTALRVREYHPANAGGNYLDPLPPPACEIVSAGRDRLWLAGGELSPGEVAPSRLFFPGQAPAFSPGLNIQVDRNAEPITAIGFVGDIAAVFRETSTYTIESDGPDNSLNGTWAQPRLAIADTGAIGQESLALTTLGLWFQSPAGLRLMTNSGTMDREAGRDTDPLTIGAAYSAAIVVPQHSQVRWYSRDESKPTVVLDYSMNAWMTWTGLTCNGAVFWPTSNLAAVAKGDGYLWIEEDGLYTDNNSPFETIVRTAWLHAAQLGDFQRLRRFALFGNATAPVSLRTRLFYDERQFHDEEIIRQYPEPTGAGVIGVFNDSIWGGGLDDPDANQWGTMGPWGDDNNITIGGVTTPFGDSLWFRDGVFKLRIRPNRQKCSVFSIEFSDQSGTSAGFVPVVLALELARKQGLDRIPTPSA